MGKSFFPSSISSLYLIFNPPMPFIVLSKIKFINYFFYFFFLSIDRETHKRGDAHLTVPKLCPELTAIYGFLW